MIDSWSMLPEPITESQLLQLDIGDEFYEVDLGNKGRFAMTKVAERNTADVGWNFEGKILELNDVDCSDKNERISFFISDEAGFMHCTISLTSKYYGEPE